MAKGDHMTTPLLTTEQVAEVMRLHEDGVMARIRLTIGRGVIVDAKRADQALEQHLRSLTAPAPVQPVVKEALTTPFDPEALIDIRGSRDEP